MVVGVGKIAQLLESPDWSSREPRFSCQNPYGSTQPSATLVLEHLTASAPLWALQACTWCTDIHTNKTFMYIKMYKFIKIKIRVSVFYI